MLAVRWTLTPDAAYEVDAWALTRVALGEVTCPSGVRVIGSAAALRRLAAALTQAAVLAEQQASARGAYLVPVRGERP